MNPKTENNVEENPFASVLLAVFPTVAVVFKYRKLGCDPWLDSRGRMASDWHPQTKILPVKIGRPSI